MQATYKLGINIIGETSEMPQKETLEMLKRTGWQAFFSVWNTERIEGWAENAAKLGLVYQSIHAPFTSVHKMWQDGEEGREVAKSLCECVRDCARFDIPVMVIHPFIGFHDHTPTETGLDNYARVVETADKLGVKLGFENVEGEEYLAALMEKFWEHPSLGFCFDSGHELCYNRGKDMLALYGEKLVHTHLNDNLGVTGEAITWHDDLHLVMGDGIADWKNVMDRIEKTGYTDILMCELTLKNKPDKHTHDAYAAMPREEFFAFAHDRAVRVVNRTL